MNGSWRLAMLALGMSLCLSAAVLPDTRVYSVHVPGAIRVEARVSHSAGWDVAVSFDPRTCEISCEYRRRTGGWTLFLPPVLELRTYTDGVSRPLIATVDPAGAALPRLAARPAPPTEPACLGGRAAATTAGCESAPFTTVLPPLPMVGDAPASGLSTTCPLRI